MEDNNYPHKEAIENLEIISPLISLIEESKEKLYQRKPQPTLTYKRNKTTKTSKFTFPTNT